MSRAVCACHLLVTDASLGAGDGGGGAGAGGGAGQPAGPVRIVACYEDFELLFGLRQVVGWFCELLAAEGRRDQSHGERVICGVYRL